MGRGQTITIIANPISGGGAAYRKAQVLSARLTKLGMPCRVLTTGRTFHGRELARESAGESSVVVAVGGDGTVNEVVEGLAGTETPLVVLPTGTANVLAHELRITRHVGSALKAIVRGRHRHMDLGHVIDPQDDPNRRNWFACMASCGFDAAVARSMHLQRTGSINYGHYVPVTVKAFCDYTYPSLSVKLDGCWWPREVRHVVICNTRSYGGPFRIATKAHCDDGLFDVVLLEHGGPVWMLAYMAAMVVRAQFVLPGVKMVRARGVRVESRGPAMYQLDGDFVGYTPFEVEMEAGALPVLTARRREDDERKSVQD